MYGYMCVSTFVCPACVFPSRYYGILAEISDAHFWPTNEMWELEVRDNRWLALTLETFEFMYVSEMS